MADARPADRIRAHTPPAVNDCIDSATLGMFERYRRAGSPAAIAARMDELDREWDIDRALMAVFAVAGTTVHELSLRRSPAWSRLLRLQLGFLFWHATVGWCPPVSLLRRMGFRSRHEIEREKTALRGLLMHRQAQQRALAFQQQPPPRPRQQPRSSAEARIGGDRPDALRQALAEQRARPKPRPAAPQQRPQIIPPARPATPPRE